MQQLIQLLGQLNDDERNNLTTWISKLTQREGESVKINLSKMSVDEIRTILNIPENQRISIFPVDNSFSVNNKIDILNKKLEKSADDFHNWRLERKAKRNQS